MPSYFRLLLVGVSICCLLAFFLPFILELIITPEGHNGRVEIRRQRSTPCPLPGDLAVSALQRMKTDECKERVHSIACDIHEGTLHETFPPSSCDNFDKSLVDQSVGCFSDSKDKRLLTGHSYKWPDKNSPERCGLFCTRAGYVYYGVEFGIECFCGNVLEGKAARVEDERCETHNCTSTGRGELCGGFNAIRVYRTGITEPLVWKKPEYVSVTGIHEEEERGSRIRILFLLQLNGRNVRQVRQLLKSVYSPRHHYYIHVDDRQTYMLREARRLSALLPNVRVAKTLRPTIWGASSLLPMVLDAIEDSLHISWDYLVNLSESDELILSLREMEAQLEDNNGSSFLASHGQSTGRFLEKQGVDYVFLECEQRMWRVANRPSFPRNVGLNGGSDWVVLHRTLAEYAVAEEGEDVLPSQLRRLFGSFILPVESFFHSLAVNSRFCRKVLGSNLRLTNWNRKYGGCKCQGLKKVVDWCGCSPLSFTPESSSRFDLEKAKERAVYMARKFDSIVSSEAIGRAIRQSSRLFSSSPSPLFNFSHSRANASMVNAHDAELDKSNPALTSFIRSLLPSGEDRLKELFVYKEGDEKEMRMGAVFEDAFGNHRERLFDMRREVQMEEELQIDDFILESASVGVSIDYKEEIFRGYAGFIPIDGHATILLEWSTVNVRKDMSTSPPLKLDWSDGTGSVRAEQTVPGYDSARGRQFAELDISTLDDVEPGIWSVVVRDSTRRLKLATVTFPVFSTNDSQSAALVERFYPLKEECHSTEECFTKPWSSLYPDPFSDIKQGWDEERQRLL